jgi:hypothetical protein
MNGFDAECVAVNHATVDPTHEGQILVQTELAQIAFDCWREPVDPLEPYIFGPTQAHLLAQLA